MTPEPTCALCATGESLGKTRVALTLFPLIGTTLPVVRYSPHRSKRQWKKLHQRGARPLYGPRTTLYASPGLMRALDKLRKGTRR